MRIVIAEKWRTGSVRPSNRNRFKDLCRSELRLLAHILKSAHRRHQGWGLLLVVLTKIHSHTA